jgi:hypothetical protein
MIFERGECVSLISEISRNNVVPKKGRTYIRVDPDYFPVYVRQSLRF